MLQIQGQGLGCAVVDAPGFHKALLFTAGEDARVVIPFDEQGWRAFQAMVAKDGAARVMPVGAEALASLPPPPRKMAVPRG